MTGALAMFGALLWCQVSAFFKAVVFSIAQGIRPLWDSRAGKGKEEDNEDYALYEGEVYHERKHPVRHQFTYKVRYALVNLNNVPAWFTASSTHHMTAQEVRSIVGTTGPIHLLCIPASVGYEQNPISVYYCYDDAGSLVTAMCDVTNTPWGERVTFVFDPKGDTLAKRLFVSPLMDMAGSWVIRADVPGEKLALSVRVKHPEFGKFFVATLRAKRIHGQNPERFSWLMPHKVAVWIYWQAAVLLWKGVAFVQHPKYVDGSAYRKRAEDRDLELKGRTIPKNPDEQLTNVAAGPPRFCLWREAAGPPWL